MGLRRRSTQAEALEVVDHLRDRGGAHLHAVGEGLLGGRAELVERDEHAVVADLDRQVAEHRVRAVAGHEVRLGDQEAGDVGERRRDHPAGIGGDQFAQQLMEAGALVGGEPRRPSRGSRRGPSGAISATARSPAGVTWRR